MTQKPTAKSFGNTYLSVNTHLLNQRDLTCLTMRQSKILKLLVITKKLS